MISLIEGWVGRRWAILWAGFVLGAVLCLPLGAWVGARGTAATARGARAVAQSCTTLAGEAAAGLRRANAVAARLEYWNRYADSVTAQRTPAAMPSVAGTAAGSQ